VRRLLPLALLLIGCSQPDNGSHLDNIGHYVGRSCTLRVKPETLGLSATMPMPLETDSLNGASVAISGDLVAIDGSWVILRKGTPGTDLQSGKEGTDVVIARSEVLSMTFNLASNP